METEKNEKNEKKFECIYCDFRCSFSADWTRHLATRKHSVSVNGNHLEINGNILGEKNETPKFSCFNCNKKYNTNSGLWKHNKICKFKNTNNNILDCVQDDTNLDIQPSNVSNDVMMMILKQNSDIIKEQSEFKNLILEIVKNGTINNSITNTVTTNSNNKSFNLNFFLNETCKNAMNIDEFADSIKLQVSDFMRIGEVGFIQGVSDIIIKYLNSLDVTLRPIHCTDKKREVFYVKDAGKWEKEDAQRMKIRKVIKKVIDKNQRLMPKFREKHPDCTLAKSVWSDSYSKMVYEAMGGHGDNNLEKEDKIIRNIAKEVTIERT